jgi:hypothetical protein
MRFRTLLILMFAGLLPGFSGNPMPGTPGSYQTSSDIDQMKQNIRDYKDAKDAQNAADKAGKAAGQVGKGAKIGKSAGSFLDAYKALSDKDSSYDPNYNPPGAPQVPSHCPDGSCSCFEGAYEKLNRTRANLERLRAVRGVTEDFYKASVSFGDDVSGIHGVAGLAWQAERRKIEASFKGFKTAYNQKYQELMGNLHEALMEVSECENKEFNEPDWYDRYGFMYYQFMESRYAW